MWCERVSVFLLLLFEKCCNCREVVPIITTSKATFESISEDIEPSTVSLENIISSYMSNGPTEAFNFEDTTDEIVIPTVRVTLFEHSTGELTTTEQGRQILYNATEEVIHNKNIDTTTQGFTSKDDSNLEIPTTTETLPEISTETIEPTNSFGDTFEESTPEFPVAEEQKLSERLLELLEHFKEPNPEGIPGVDIPDPSPVPDEKHSVTFFDTLYLRDSAVYGFSKLHLLYINADLENLEVHAAMTVDHLQTRGNYLLSSFLMPRQGTYTVNISGLKIAPSASLGVQTDGKLKTKDFNMNLDFLSNETSITVEFENLDSILQNFINSRGNQIFEQMKPGIISRTYTQAREDIDKQLEDIAGDIEFPNSISPLDMVLIDTTRKVKELGMDPFKLDDYKNSDSMSFLTVSVSQSWITGLSTFHRLGDVILRLENNTVTADVEIGTQKLEGMTRWDISVGVSWSMAGSASFSVQFVALKIKIAQPLDVRERPVLIDFYLDLGIIEARCDGAGTFDYVIELAVNVLPNLLRYQIIASLNGPLKTKLQENLDSLNVEEEIKRALPKIDELAKQGFKLSFLRSKVDRYDEDDFFNF